MGWTDPAAHVYAVGELVTPATLNTYVKNNLIDLDRRTTVFRHQIETLESTTSTSFANLVTVGPTVSVEIGQSGRVQVAVFAGMANSLANALGAMTFTMTGANTYTPDPQALPRTLALTSVSNAANGQRASAIFTLDDLLPGVTTFQAKYRTDGGTQWFRHRELAVTPLGS